MRQDLNPNQCSSLVIFGSIKGKEVDYRPYFFQQVLARLVEMTESDGET